MSVQGTKICPFCGEDIKISAIKCCYCGSMLNTNTIPMNPAQSGKTETYLTPGMRLGDYEIVRLIGEGGMGVVYETIYHGLGEPVKRAIKTVPDVINKDPRSLRKLQKEVFIASSLGHPNIVRVYGLEQYHDIYFITMEYIEGYDFREYLDKKGGKISVDETVDILKGVAEALDYAHGLEKPIIHRDLKPQNLIYDIHSKQLKIVDFGIAAEITDSITTLTQTKMGTSGSPRYMCYEQFMGEEPAIHMDSYAFGIIVYESLNGEPPFVRGDIAIQHKEKEIKPIASIPQNINNAIKNLTHKNYADRPIKLKGILSKSKNDIIEHEIVNKNPIENNLKNKDKFYETKNVKLTNSKNKKLVPIVITSVIVLIIIFGLFLYTQKDFLLGKYNYQKENYYNAKTYLLRASKKKNKKALNLLANIYYFGLGTNKDQSKSFVHYKSSAEMGYADAQYMLGVSYLEGNGIEKDSIKALKWLKESASQDNDNAQKELGDIYINGIDNIVDSVKAINWYIVSANNGNLEAQVLLGEYNDRKKKYETAFRYYMDAAKNGDINSMNYVGVYLYDGKGVEQDYNKAIKWYRKSAEKDHNWAQNNLGLCYYYGRGVEQNYTEALKWFKKSAEQNNPSALYYMGLCYYEGNGIEQDYYKSLELFIKAADQDYSNAEFMIGLTYSLGNGVSADNELAVIWYEKAADQNNSNALYALGHCYYYGKGVLQDYNKSLELYEKSAMFENNEALLELGLIYMMGEIVEKDIYKSKYYYNIADIKGSSTAGLAMGTYYFDQKKYSEALKWFEKSAIKGNIQAKYFVGALYAIGQGTVRDMDKAIELFKDAAALGDSNSQLALGHLFRNKKPKKAFEYYSLSAGHGDKKAQESLGDCYKNGIGVKKNMEMANYWYEMAKEK